MPRPRKSTHTRTAAKRKPNRPPSGRFARLAVWGLCAFCVGLGSVFVPPSRLFASTAPAAPLVRSTTRPVGIDAETETQPAGRTRRDARTRQAANAAPSDGSSAPAVSPADRAARSAVASPASATSTVALTHPPAAVPTVVPHARAAVIIDDCGNNNATTQTFLDAPAAVTLAILPHLTFSRQIAREAHDRGKGVMLHFPMEANGPQNPGPGTLRVAMSARVKQETIDQNLAAVPDLEGVNNHEGSKATTDPETMHMVLGAVRQRKLFWIDSATTPDSKAYEVAAKLGLRFGRRDVFLDNNDNIEAIKENFRLLIAEARNRGEAIGIGHARVNTATAFIEMLPAFEEAGVKLVPVGDLTRIPQAAKENPR